MTPPSQVCAPWGEGQIELENVMRCVSCLAGVVALALAGAALAAEPFNPQPDPPRQSTQTKPQVRGKTALNPQPEPPGSTARLNPQPLPPGSTAQLNPQPLPPGPCRKPDARKVSGAGAGKGAQACANGKH